MIAAGIVLALAAAAADAVAIVLQAAEARQTPASAGGHFSLLAQLAHRPRWLAGTGLLVLVWPLQVLALTFAPLTAVQPILSMSLLVLLAIARFKLREPIGTHEVLGVLSIVVGVTAVLVAAPRHDVIHPHPLRLAIPLAVVGSGVLFAYVGGRRRTLGAWSLVVGAGLGYAWSDFANKLVSNELSAGRLWLAIAWLAATLAVGSIAFLQENTALQRRSAVTVAPVIGAVQGPLPVLMALAAGVERWSSSASHITALACGLALVAAGAWLLGRSGAVARISSAPAAGRAAAEAP